MKRVVVAPLNWGLGHATRCVPIINALINSNFTPILASDGSAFKFLKKEFPQLETLELPSYGISYGKHLKLDLVKNLPRFLQVMEEEHQVIQKYIQSNEVVGTISDNRFGVYSEKIPSVYITHQLNVKAQVLTPFTSYFHQRIIKRFDECWIPDEEGSRFSGELSLSEKTLNQKYIGIQSRLQKRDLEKTVNILILLSGPEPNRTQLEEKLRVKFQNSDLNVCLIQGKVEDQKKMEVQGNLTIINFVLTQDLEDYLNAAKLVVCRSGYSSIMDLIALGKKAVLIPTEGQSEQEYLAKFLAEKGLFDWVKEKEIDQYEFKINTTSTMQQFEKKEFDPSLFHLFHGE
jgi:uncharacterized protein (TIGR00661 family)